MIEENYEPRCWVRLGTRVGLCFRETINELFWEDWPCLYCNQPILNGEHWWHVPDDFVPPTIDHGCSYGFCSSCIKLFRVRARHVPRDMWEKEMSEQGHGLVGESAGRFVAWQYDYPRRRQAEARRRFGDWERKVRDFIGPEWGRP